MSFLTASITSSGRMDIQAGVEVGGGERGEWGGGWSVLDSSPSSVFPFTRAGSLSAVSGGARWRPGQSPLKHSMLLKKIKKFYKIEFDERSWFIKIKFSLDYFRS